MRKDINFVGYTYKKDVEEQKLQLVAALKDTLTADYGNGGSQADMVASDEGPRKVPQKETASNYHQAQAVMYAQNNNNQTQQNTAYTTSNNQHYTN